jgi:hypothetical protein
MAETYSAVYPQRKTFLKYSDKKIIAYLNEKPMANYLPDNAMEGQQPFDGFQYTGTERDGGTILDCPDAGNYDDVVNALIRASYSQSHEDSIYRHQVAISKGLITDEDEKEKYEKEFENFNASCEEAKTLAKSWLGL